MTNTYLLTLSSSPAAGTHRITFSRTAHHVFALCLPRQQTHLSMTNRPGWSTEGRKHVCLTTETIQTLIPPIQCKFSQAVGG